MAALEDPSELDGLRAYQAEVVAHRSLAPPRLPTPPRPSPPVLPAHAGLSAPAVGSHHGFIFLRNFRANEFPRFSPEFELCLTFAHENQFSRNSSRLRHSKNFPRSGNWGRCRNDVLGRLAARLTDDGKVSCLIEVQTHLEASSRGGSRAEAKQCPQRETERKRVTCGRTWSATGFSKRPKTRPLLKGRAGER